MNTTRRFQFLMLLLLAFVFTGCDELFEDTTLKADSFNGKLTVKVENGAAYNSQISKVWVLFEADVTDLGQLTGRIATECKYADGGFTVDLPAISAQFLMNIQTFFTTVLNVSGELDYSEPDARLMDVDFFAISSDNNFVDFFLYAGTGAKSSIGYFVYVDSDVTVKGGTNIAVMLKKGWNRIYVSSEKVVSNPPAGMKWYLYSDVK